MQRSPPGRSESDPNMYVAQRKRKHGEDFTTIFNEFTKDMMCKMAEWKADFSIDISKISENIISVKKDLSKLHEDSEIVKSEINGIREDYKKVNELTQNLISDNLKINTEMDSIKTSMQFHSTQFDECNKIVHGLTVEIKKITLLETTLTDLQGQHRQLKQQMNANEQREILLNIEVIGIPETINEQPSQIILNIARVCGVDMAITDIIYANRVTPKIKQQGRPRIIIAKLASRLLKDNIVSSARKVRLTTKELGISGEIKPLYVNDNLTPYNKQLLMKCKEAAKNKEYQYIWPKNGRIYIRKNDTSPPIQITDTEDIKLKIV